MIEVVAAVLVAYALAAVAYGVAAEPVARWYRWRRMTPEERFAAVIYATGTAMQSFALSARRAEDAVDAFRVALAALFTEEEA